jgi:hypothetical protein
VSSEFRECRQRPENPHNRKFFTPFSQTLEKVLWVKTIARSGFSATPSLNRAKWAKNVAL